MARPPTPEEEQSARISTSLIRGKPVLASLKARYGEGRKGEHIAAAVLYTEKMLRTRKAKAADLKSLYDKHVRKRFRDDPHMGQMFD